MTGEWWGSTTPCPDVCPPAHRAGRRRVLHDPVDHPRGRGFANRNAPGVSPIDV